VNIERCGHCALYKCKYIYIYINIYINRIYIYGLLKSHCTHILVEITRRVITSILRSTRR